MRTKFRLTKKVVTSVIAAAMVLTTTTVASGDAGDVVTTPVSPMENPVEIEIETAPGSLKEAPTWPELVQLLEEPYEEVERRPFGDLDPLRNIPLDYNFLTAEPLRLRPNDGEVSLDQPGILVDPGEGLVMDTADDFNAPTTTRTPVGALVASDDVDLDANEIPPQIYQQLGVTPPDGYDPVPCETIDLPLDATWSDQTCGYLLVYNPDGSTVIPPDGTVVGVPAWVDLAEGPELEELRAEHPEDDIEPGRFLRELEFEVDSEGEFLPWHPVDGDYEIVLELEAPVNEENFLRDEADVAGVDDPELQELIGRPAAEILGKSLFWDMQVGSDGVQACGSCHFAAGADNRNVNQINPDSLGGDTTFDIAAPNEPVTAEDFPFRKLIDPGAISTTIEEANCGPDHVNGACSSGNLFSDANDVLSSMGVSQFKDFQDIPEIGAESFNEEDVPALKPDIGNPRQDPIPDMDGFRRVEPRNTPTFHGAAFNLDNFWDSRARFNFNGGSVFGPSDPEFHIWVNDELEGMHGLPDPSEDTIEEPLAEWAPEAGEPEVPARIKFSSLASQAVGPPLSEFEMSFLGRNWPKIGKKMLQSGVTPLANQLVATDDSLLGEFSNQHVAAEMPGLDITYNELIELAFDPALWNNTTQHFTGAACDDPFDGYCLTLAEGAADPFDRDQFTQMEANFSMFFGLAVQTYEELTIPDDSPFDRFLAANPFAVAAVGQSGEQAVLFPTLVPDLIDDGVVNGTHGTLTLVEGFGAEEILGMDIFMGSNLTAALPPGEPGVEGGPGNRNPTSIVTNEDGDSIEIAVGSNPFSRSARCMLCHLGPEQTDHSINISHGLLKGDAEFEFPDPPFVPDPGYQVVGGGVAPLFTDGNLPAPEAPGPNQVVGGLILSEEVEETPQDAVEVEPRDFATFDDPATWWDDAVVAQQRRFSFGDQGIYNLGLRPSDGDNQSDIGRGGDDPFERPLSTATLTLQNIGGEGFVPGTPMANVDPLNFGATFEESGDGTEFPLPDGSSSGHGLATVNPGFERCPINEMLPDYMAKWVNCLPAGELHPEIDEQSGMGINVLTEPTGGPLNEFAEALFGADPHCGLYDPATFGEGSPNFGWGPLCPNNQSGVASNLEYPIHGTWPEPNQVLRDGAFKAPSLRNVELTGPYFHTGSYLTLRQVVDFYMRGGDFPNTNHAHRDPNIINVREQAFGFGRTSGLNQIFDCSGAEPNIDGVTPQDCGVFTWLVGNFADALPDTVYLYDEMPDTDHPLTPEYLTPDEAEDALVSFLISLTDQRVKHELAPFDHPEIFVPLDGRAPENTPGRQRLVALSTSRCPGQPLGFDLTCFKQVPESGAGGIANGVPNFLGISSQPDPTGPDHFDRFTDPDLEALSPTDATAEVTLDATQIAFALDEGLKPGPAFGERWVSPGAYSIAVDPGYIIPGRAEKRLDTGRSVVASSTWSSSNNKVVEITEIGGGVSGMKIKGSGTAKVTVQSGSVTKTLDVEVKKLGTSLIVRVRN
jgi:cytochrome c peroxidase